MHGKYLNLLGLAYRAKACVLGVDQIIQQVRLKRVKLVLIAKDCGPQTLKQITDKCTTYKTPYKIVDEKDVISHAIGQKNRAAIAITNDGFAKKLESLIDGN